MTHASQKASQLNSEDRKKFENTLVNKPQTVICTIKQTSVQTEAQKPIRISFSDEDEIGDRFILNHDTVKSVTGGDTFYAPKLD